MDVNSGFAAWLASQQQQPYGVSPMQGSVDPSLLGNNGPTIMNASWQTRLGALGKSVLGDRDLAYALLANSGPSPQPRSFGQVFGQSALQAQQMRQQRENSALDSFYKQAQIQHLINPPRKPVPVFRDGKIMYEDEDKAVGQEVGLLGNQAKASADLQAYALYAQQEKQAGREPKSLEEWHQEWLNQRPIQPQVIQPNSGGAYVIQPTRGGGVGGSTTLSTPGQDVAHAGDVAGSKTGAEAMATRNQEFITAGVAAADSVPLLRRTLKLLNSVPTGGLDNAKLAATNFLGVTGADEGELSRNMGIAIIKQLRPSFGAQFTKAEGDKLSDIEANFGKSAEVNKRLIRQALEIAQNAAERGADAAHELKDPISEKAIRRSLDRILLDEKPRTAEEIIEEQRRKAGGGS